jgi:hypothetical protein
VYQRTRALQASRYLDLVIAVALAVALFELEVALFVPPIALLTFATAATGGLRGVAELFGCGSIARELRATTLKLMALCFFCIIMYTIPQLNFDCFSKNIGS